MANSVDPDHTALIWVCTVCLDLSVPLLRIFSSPGQSPGRAIVLLPGSALASVSALENII